MIDASVISVEQFSPDQVTIGLTVPPDHPAFAGHFPDRPILPGVVQIDWALRLADQYLSTGCPAACDYQVKFRRLITAGEALSLDLRLIRERGVLDFSYRVGDAAASSGRVRINAA